MLMSADRCGVDVDIPVDAARSIHDGLDVLEQPFPGVVGRPQLMPLLDRLPRAETLGQRAPLAAGAEPVNDPVDHLAVVPPSAAPIVARGQQRLQHRPLLVREIPPC